jgi:hypothetical protein
VRRFGLAETECHGVHGHLQQRDAPTEHEERNEEPDILAGIGSGQKQQCRKSNDHETRDKTSNIADPAEQFSRGYRENRIAREKSELNEVCLKMGKLEQSLELRDQNIVDIGHAAQNEKNGKNQQQDNLGFIV